MERPKNGKIFLIGAGPGDPNLLTLRAAHCLSRCDVVLYDYLANPKSLQHVKSDAEVICLGKHGSTRIWTQQEIDDALVAHARNGKAVAHLKGGDPMIFGRVASELTAAKEAGIEVEIVPGISAAVAAASFAGIPITHRSAASAVAFVTGHEMAERTESQLDFAALAAFPGTLVVYMGVTSAGQWSGKLIDAGKPAATPIAIIRRCSLPDQKIVLTTLGEVAGELVPAKVRPPAVVVIGSVANMSKDFDWFSKRPLFGQTILVTRPLHQTEDLAKPLQELGANVLVQPAIAIGPPDDWTKVDEVISSLSEFEWIAFSSSNGVQHFFERLWQLGYDARMLGNTRIAVIGPGTAAALENYRLKPDLLPNEYRAESLAEAIVESCPSGKVLLVRASRGREVLSQMLEQAGVKVEQVVAYESTDVVEISEEVANFWDQQSPEWVTVTSSAIAKSLHKLFGQRLKESKLASISPITSATLRELGLEPTVEAEEYTMPGLVEAILQHID